MVDLYGADRDELIRLVLAQREALAEQAALVAQLRAELAAAQATGAQLALRVG